jgi:cysteine desulfurase
MLSLGGHKFYGPKGVGALIVKKDFNLRAIQTGGSHESGLRAGTPNTPYIVGMVKAYEITRQKMDQFNSIFKKHTQWLFNEISKNIEGTHLTGDDLSDRLPNHLSMVFDNVDGNQLITVLSQKGFACSSGSACKTGSPKPSGVLLAIGIPENLAIGSLRITVGRQTSHEELKAFANALEETIKICRVK